MRHRIPLLRDRHSHPMLYAALMDAVDLNQPGVTRESAMAAIRERALAGGTGWTIATGWNSGRVQLDKTEFDDLPPVVVLALSIHGLLVNDAGRLLLRQQDEVVADHLDDQDWIERNLRRVLNLFARAGASPERLRAFFDQLRTLGVYSAEEMLLVGEDEIRLFDEAGLGGRTQFWAAPETYESASPANRDRIHGIKLFTDGAIGVTTAALNVPYRTAPHTGLLLYEDAGLQALIALYAPVKPMAIHAIGDAAVEQVVSAVERLSARPGWFRQLIRIEHAQFISEAVGRRAKDLGIHLCMQPNFSDDSVAYADRLPAGYPERNNPFRMLIDRVGYVPGDDLYFGSDGMPHGIQEALRQSLFPGYEGQKLSFEEFVAGYCGDGAHGTIEVEIDEFSMPSRLV